jgi:hypothetical protein
MDTPKLREGTDSRTAAANEPDPPLLHDVNPPSPWQPEQNKIRLAALGKLAEELAEAGAIVARCIIQGVDESEPVTGKLNRDALWQELADVRAAQSIVEDLFDLPPREMSVRTARKRLHLRMWHDMIRGLPWRKSPVVGEAQGGSADLLSAERKA